MGSRERSLESRIARLLAVGTYGSVTLLAVGVGLLIATGRSPLEAAPTLDPGGLPGDLGALRPVAFLWLGLIAIILTPAARVAVAGLAYLRSGERAMAVVGLLILIVITLGVVAGLVAGPPGG